MSGHKLITSTELPITTGKSVPNSDQVQNLMARVSELEEERTKLLQEKRLQDPLKIDMIYGKNLRLENFDILQYLGNYPDCSGNLAMSSNGLPLKEVAYWKASILQGTCIEIGITRCISAESLCKDNSSKQSESYLMALKTQFQLKEKDVVLFKYDPLLQGLVAYNTREKKFFAITDIKPGRYALALRLGPFCGLTSVKISHIADSEKLLFC
mmetsp:Transcript_27542/g.27766  ORF Transcript_27542/g.27766 Transcript_27542/m.27766 type:complete len:212 (+) Transcript_27542:98-733(+)